MINTRKLWLLGALAFLGACDPYDDENSGDLQVLSAFAVQGDSSDFATGLFEASETASPFTIGEIDSGSTVFFVKANKLLDGAAIQADPLSCVPAAAVNLTVNGVTNPPDWFTCYVPATSTPAEGASMVIYHGSDIDITTGYFDAADLEPGFLDIIATLTDKQGNQETVTINAAVRLSAPSVVSVTPTSAVATWGTGIGATAYTVERAPNVLDEDGHDAPGDFAPIAADLGPTVGSFDDSGLTAETKYWYRVVMTKGSVTATSDPTMILTAVAPGAPTLAAVAATATAAKRIDVTWTQVTSQVSTYFVERTTTPADEASWKVVGTKAASTTATTLTVSDAGTTAAPLVTGTVYHYRIKAGGTDWETIAGPSASVTSP